MTTPTTPWHRQSFDDFLHHRLPELLTARLRLFAVAERTGPRSCRVTVRPAAGGAEVVFEDLPAPDDDGLFEMAAEAAPDPGPSSFDPPVPVDVSGSPRVPPPPESPRPASPSSPSATEADDGPVEVVVLPRADGDDLAAARIDCVGEQLLAFLDGRLSRLPEPIDLDADLVRALLPLDTWFRAFLAQRGQRLQETNWLARAAHLRRLLVPDRTEAFTPGHFGRTCPFETPEGPNIARVLTISRGADVRDGRLLSAGDDPVARLGVTAACIPFLEHDDGNRVLMGANMMRQWLLPGDIEPALVQTGCEPEGAAGFWCGRNLLTAFISWDGNAFEDALVISETGSRKLACPQPLEAGDKLSNRHGIKGVISQVRLDDDMPKLPDGTAVELVFSVCGVPSRWMMGQLREAALSHVARRHGAPVTVPPFAAPDDDDLRARITAAGLPADGLLQLTCGGTPLKRRSTAGWVYWGCTLHRARLKLHGATHPRERPQRLGRMEVQALREAGAERVIRELGSTLSAEREDAGSLAERVAAGGAAPDDGPSPSFVALAAKLTRAGIGVRLTDAGVAFGLRDDAEGALPLAEPVPHPWLPDRQVTHLDTAALPEAGAVVADADERLRHVLASHAPTPLLDAARQALARAVKAFLDRVVARDDLAFGTWTLFSGRAVLTPGEDLAIDRLGVPEDLAWRLYWPQVTARLGDARAVEDRTDAARLARDELMAGSWLIFNRAPSLGPRSLLAFRPLAVPGHAIRLHPLAVRLLDADFDGDQGALFALVSEAAQAEAAARLTVAGHLQRDPDLIDEVVPVMDACFGLACLSRSAEGRARIAAAGGGVDFGDGIWGRREVVQHLRHVRERDGVAAALRAAEALMHLGFEAARAEGASVGPFVGHSLKLPAPPEADDVDTWQVWQEEVHGIVAGVRDYDDEDVGAVCLLSHSGARATTQQVASLFAPGGPVHDLSGDLYYVRHSWREGLSARDAEARVVGARRGLFRLHAHVAALAEEHERRSRPTGYGVLARARRCNHPGLAIARAAARGEVDPLADDYARIFVGVSP